MRFDPMNDSRARLCMCVVRLAMFAIVALPAAIARADTPMFGAAGQIVPSGSVGLELEFGMGSPGAEDDVGRDLAVSVVPGLLYFFAPNLAVGVGVDLIYVDRELQPFQFTELYVGASLGFGVHASVSEIVGFFPRLWLGGGYMRRNDEPNRFAGAFTDPTFQLMPTSVTEGPYLGGQLVLPLIFQLAHATFISVGPSVRANWAVEHGTRTLELGFNLGVGRYF